LKQEHFQILLILGEEEDQAYISEPEPTITKKVRNKRLSNKARLPTKDSKIAVGHDINAISEFTIAAHGPVLGKTGIVIGLRKGTYARIAPRGGLGSQKGMAINGGVIDADYTG